MLSEENKVSLIVEGHNLSSFEFWLLREQSRKESSYSSADFCVEIIQNQFWEMVCSNTMMEKLLVQFDSRYLFNQNYNNKNTLKKAVGPLGRCMRII